MGRFGRSELFSVFEFCENPKHNYSSYYSYYRLSNPAVCSKSEQAEKPASDYAAQNAENKIDKTTAAFTLLEQAGDISGDKAGNDSRNYYHKYKYVGLK